MYALIKTGGKEYNVAVGSIIEVEKLDGKSGDEIVFNSVLMIADDEDVKIGKPYLNGAKVVAEIVDQVKGEKKIAFKRKRKKGYKKKIGHRQKYTSLKIKGITK